MAVSEEEAMAIVPVNTPRTFKVVGTTITQEPAEYEYSAVTYEQGVFPDGWALEHKLTFVVSATVTLNAFSYDVFTITMLADTMETQKDKHQATKAQSKMGTKLKMTIQPVGAETTVEELRLAAGLKFSHQLAKVSSFFSRIPPEKIVLMVNGALEKFFNQHERQISLDRGEKTFVWYKWEKAHTSF